jgi:hypothetical protein
VAVEVSGEFSVNIATNMGLRLGLGVRLGLIATLGAGSMTMG